MKDDFTKTTHGPLADDYDPPPGRPEKMAQILHDPASLSVLRTADIILGVDEATGNVFLVYGARLLEKGIWTKKTVTASIVQVPILQATLELEALIDAVTAVKGRCDYKGGDKKAVTIPVRSGRLS